MIFISQAKHDDQPLISYCCCLTEHVHIFPSIVTDVFDKRSTYASSLEPSGMNIAGVMFTCLCMMYDQLFFLLRALAICSLFAVAAASLACFSSSRFLAASSRCCRMIAKRARSARASSVLPSECIFL